MNPTFDPDASVVTITQRDRLLRSAALCEAVRSMGTEGAFCNVQVLCGAILGMLVGLFYPTPISAFPS